MHEYIVKCLNTSELLADIKITRKVPVSLEALRVALHKGHDLYHVLSSHHLPQLSPVDTVQ